jgi:3-deoxy-D-manno-octulosonic-acid transferase
MNELRLEKLKKALAGRNVLKYTDMEKMINEGGKAVAERLLVEADVLIIDCFGKLSSIYRYGEIALVGGGFGVGIHNVPEAAVYSIPVVFGPNNKKFNEAQELKECGGSFEYKDAQSFANILDELIDNPESLEKAGKAAGQYITTHIGATQKCYDAIFGNIPQQ